MKPMLLMVLAGLLCGCGESPERELARRELVRLDRREALQRIEEAARFKGRMVAAGGMTTEDVENLQAHVERAMDEGEAAGLGRDEIHAAMVRGYSGAD